VRDRALHFTQVNGGVRGIGDVDDPAIGRDQKADAAVHVFMIHADTVEIGDFALSINEEGEVQIVFEDETLMAVGVVKTDANDLDIALFEIGHSIAEAASFGGAAFGIVLWIEIKEDGLLPDKGFEFPFDAVLIVACEDGRFVAHHERKGPCHERGRCRGEGRREDRAENYPECFHKW
jgi:hypothetical protein